MIQFHKFLLSAWKWRFLFIQLLSRDIKNRYLGSISGFFWLFIQPMAQLAIYHFVFSTIFRVKFPQLGEQDFIVFVAAALWPWLAFSEGLQRATVSIQNHADLIKKVNMPYEVLVIIPVISSYVVHGLGYLLVLLVLPILGFTINVIALPLIIALFLMQSILTVSLGFITSAFQVFLRDLEQILSSLLMIGFYVTPILYPRDLVPPNLLFLVDLNPLSYFIGHIRTALFSQPQFYFIDLLWILGIMGFFYLSWRLFHRCANRFEDFI